MHFYIYTSKTLVNLPQTMDELFLLPPCPVAMPRAYWLNPDDRILSSQVLLIQPSEFEFKRVMDGMEHAGSGDYDMEIVNKLYRDSALVLPHRPYDLLTGEFRSKNHGSYMGNSEEPWDPEKILKEAKFLHFSDWPIPKVCQFNIGFWTRLTVSSPGSMRISRSSKRNSPSATRIRTRERKTTVAPAISGWGSTLTLQSDERCVLPSAHITPPAYFCLHRDS